jgi:hypothetical protein
VDILDCGGAGLPFRYGGVLGIVTQWLETSGAPQHQQEVNGSNPIEVISMFAMFFMFPCF